MKLFLISQDTNIDYDIFDSAVVVAESEEQARMIQPACIWSTHRDILEYSNTLWNKPYRGGTWINSPKDVKVEYLGEAKEGTKISVICASYHIG